MPLPIAGVFAALALCGGEDRPLIAEVLYDATGDDADREFVELFNPHPIPRSLEGLRIESGDGSGADRWMLRWTGGAADTIPPASRFVVGGNLVTPPVDAVASLSLQNGPDAVRLVWPDGVIEVLGWGVHAFPEYACGEPALDAPSGFSLARVPDDGRRSSNAADFQPAIPTPGRPNRATHDAAFERGALALVPERPDPGQPSFLHGVLWNRGQADEIAGALRIRAVEPPSSILDSLTIQRPLAAGESLHVALRLPGFGAGRRTLVAVVRLAEDERPENDSDTLTVRVGPGPLEITEVQFHPANGEGEWIEVANRSGDPLDVGAFTLSDRGGQPGTPRGGTGLIAPDSLAVFAQHRAELLVRFPDIDATRVWEVVPWSALNNTNGADGIADAAIVRERDGTLSDRVDYSSASVPSGVPLERRDGGWWPSLRALGTPLAPPVVPPAVAGSFRVSPRRIACGSGIATLAWDVPWPRSRATLELYDLAGRRVARVIESLEIPSRGERSWSTRGLTPGVYVVVFHVVAADRSDQRTASQVLRVVGNGR